MHSVKLFALTLFAGLAFIFSGCAILEMHHKPDTINDENLESMLGTKKIGIIRKFGEPAKNFQQNNKNFFIYEALGDLTKFLIFMIYPVPAYDHEDNQVKWCILLEFGDDDVLKDFEMLKMRSVGGSPYDCTDPNIHWELLISPAARQAEKLQNNKVGVLILAWDWRVYSIRRRDASTPAEEGDYYTLKRLDIFTGDQPIKLPPGEYTIMFDGQYPYTINGSFSLKVEPGHEYELMLDDCVGIFCPRPPVPAGHIHGAWVWIEDKTKGIIVTEKRMFSWH